MPPLTPETTDLHTTKISKMFLFALGTLPPDVIVEILESVSLYTDLNHLLQAYPIFRAVFKSLPKQIARQIAENIVEEDSWDIFTAILIYQRERDSNRPMTDADNFAILKQNIQSEFVFSVNDIRHVTTYNNLYESCARSFITYVSERYPHVPVSIGEKPEDFTATPSLHLLPPPFHPPLHPPYHLCPLCSDRLPPPSFTAGDTLPQKLLYEVWLLYFHFTYESHEASPVNKSWTSVWFPVSSIRAIATNFKWWVRG